MGKFNVQEQPWVIFPWVDPDPPETLRRSKCILNFRYSSSRSSQVIDADSRSNYVQVQDQAVESLSAALHCYCRQPRPSRARFLDWQPPPLGPRLLIAQ